MIKEETARAQPEASTCEWRHQDDYTYTANGELETKTNRATGAAWLFQYDALGNLLTVGLPNGDLVDYLVDGLGRRVGKKKNGQLMKQWLYGDALTPAAELDGNGLLVCAFVYGSKTNVPDYVQRGGATYRVISDQLGSPRYVVNVANASDVPFTASYTSFGEVTGAGLDWMPFGFAGGMYDADSGLVRFGTRDFDPSVGRWIVRESTPFYGGLNLYVYSNDDPVNFEDVDGYEPRPGGNVNVPLDPQFAPTGGPKPSPANMPGPPPFPRPAPMPQPNGPNDHGPPQLPLIPRPEFLPKPIPWPLPQPPKPDFRSFNPWPWPAPTQPPGPGQDGPKECKK